MEEDGEHPKSHLLGRARRDGILVDEDMKQKLLYWEVGVIRRVCGSLGSM